MSSGEFEDTSSCKQCGRRFDQEQEHTYEDVENIKNYLENIIQIKPRIGIICGSGLGGIAYSIENSFSIDYTDIPNFPTSTAPGHAGRLIFGILFGYPVVCMQGRLHYYEGYSLSKCVMPVRLMKLLGVSVLIVSNAAGGLNPSFKVGDIMLQTDHFNLMGLAGNHPLRGFNDPRWGPRFFSMKNAYDAGIIRSIIQLSKDLGIEDKVHQGVYLCAGGPSYETSAELRALKVLGVDAAGMSTVHEVTAARHCGMKCFEFSLITNLCTDEDDKEVNGHEVLLVGKNQEEDLKAFIKNVVKVIGTNHL